MAKDAPAPEPPSDGINEPDYAALLATLSASERGRAFLAEYARRQRVAETEVLLAAITRVETVIAAQRAPAVTESAPAGPTAVAPELAEIEPAETEPAEPPPTRLRVVAQDAQPVQPEAPPPVASGIAPAQTTAANLAKVPWYAKDASPADDGVQIRVADDEPATAIVDEWPATTFTDHKAATTAADDRPQMAVGNDEPATGAVECAPAFASASVADGSNMTPTETELDAAVVPPTADSAPLPPNILLGQPAPSPRDEPEQEAASETLERVAPPPRDTPAQPAPPSADEPQPQALPRAIMELPAPSPNHPLAQLMALSDEERIALFS